MRADCFLLGMGSRHMLPYSSRREVFQQRLLANSRLTNFPFLCFFFFQYKPEVNATELALAFPLPENLKSPPSSRVSDPSVSCTHEHIPVGALAKW